MEGCCYAQRVPEEIQGSEKEDITLPLSFYGGHYSLEIPDRWEVCPKEYFTVKPLPHGTECVLCPKGSTRTWLLVQVIPLTRKELLGVSDKQEMLRLLKQYCLLGDDARRIAWHYEKYPGLNLDYIMLHDDSHGSAFLPLGMDIFPRKNHALVFTSIFANDRALWAKEAPYIIDIIESQKYREAASKATP